MFSNNGKVKRVGLDLDLVIFKRNSFIVTLLREKKTGKKMSPEQVEKLLRKDLNPDQYVGVQQIKSLHSRWAK